MRRIVVFPDGTRVSAQQISYWTQVAGAVNLALIGAGSSAYFNYTAADEPTARTILALIDVWYFQVEDTVLNITQALVGAMAIFSISPTTGVAANSFSVTVTGFGFVNGCKMNIGAAAYVVTFTDANTIAFAYTGNLPAGTYSITVTNPSGAGCVLTAALTLT